MFGFKLEARREGGLSEKARPIYLDMQVSPFTISITSHETLMCCARQPHP